MQRRKWRLGARCSERGCLKTVSRLVRVFPHVVMSYQCQCIRGNAQFQRTQFAAAHPPLSEVVTVQSTSPTVALLGRTCAGCSHRRGQRHWQGYRNW